MADRHPILLRPDTTLARAMTEAADQAGIARHSWIVGVLQDACREAGTLRSDLPDPDDVPLPGV